LTCLSPHFLLCCLCLFIPFVLKMYYIS
jgi:hypothetical protein